MKNATLTFQILSDYYRKNREEILQDFFTFLRFQSVSSEAAYQSEVTACAEWLKEAIQQMGLHAEMWHVPGHHPVLFASYDKAGPSQPTLLIYNHYDVQPVDPLEEWSSAPFEPTVRDGEIYARGAQDNKGQCFYVLQALKAYFNCFGSLPVNIKWCIEGEEEKGSEALSALLTLKKEELSADYLAIVDVGLEKAGDPAVTLGVRGIFTMDLELQESNIDLHSGSHGGIVFNPIHALVKLLSTLRDEEGNIAIPGFYDDVLPVTEEERAQLALDFDEEGYIEMFGTTPTGGERLFTPLERAWLRPTCEINGIQGGYHGPGFKTVIPYKASAKLSCRLVPNQDPEKMAHLVTQYLQKHVPGGMTLKVHVHPGKGAAIRANVDSVVVKAFAQAYSDVFSKPCSYIFCGGSIPIVKDLADASGAEVVLVGIGLPGDQIHAPNEHFGVNRLFEGFLTIGRAIELLSNQTHTDPEVLS
jgi:acetylornithine deacetylase/succinyl-diaminopimelate desuccinylase-like protein